MLTGDKMKLGKFWKIPMYPNFQWVVYVLPLSPFRRVFVSPPWLALASPVIRRYIKIGGPHGILLIHAPSEPPRNPRRRRSSPTSFYYLGQQNGFLNVHVYTCPRVASAAIKTMKLLSKGRALPSSAVPQCTRMYVPQDQNWRSAAANLSGMFDPSHEDSYAMAHTL